jgi:hypothetical protein
MIDRREFISAAVAVLSIGANIQTPKRLDDHYAGIRWVMSREEADDIERRIFGKSK